MRATSSNQRRRLRAGSRFRVGFATLIASSGLVSAVVFSSPRASADSLTVTNCNSSGQGSLAHVVARAAAGSTVTFSVTCSSISVTSPIDLTVPITIEGPGASAMELDSPENLDGEVFDVSPKIDVSVSGLSFQDGDPDINNEGTLTLSDCSMGSDPDQQFAVGISNEGSLTLSGCTMTGDGANLDMGNSTGLSNSGTATLSDCTMTGTETDDGPPGGAAVYNEGKLTIDSCSFKKNADFYGGGAIENDGGSVKITGSTISGNEDGAGSPAGISNDAGTMNISNSTVSGNNPQGIANDGTMNISDSTIKSNEYSGGIANDGTLSVTDSALSYNVGGAIDNEGSATITGSTISNNSVRGTAHGGGISNKGTMTIADTTVSGNNSNDGPGGGIYNDGTMSLADSTVSSNMNEGGGGGIDNASNLSVSDSTISRNTVEGGGGGGILNTKTLVVTASTLAQNIHRSVFKDNDGGGIKNVGGTVSLAATVLAEGSSYNCSGPFIDAGYNLDDDGSCGFSAANQSFSGVPPYLGPLQDNGGPTETQEPALGSPLLDDIPMGATANGVTLCPSTDQRGVARPQGSECDIGAVELSPTSQDITSSDDATATTGQPFSFTVTTTGTPTPRLSETGTLPRKLTFTDNGNGTATISGKAKKVGSSELVFTATFGKGSGKYVVLQVFTLTVTAG